ncbi:MULTISPECIES: mandelate racemase/muconate lactonizing enzyme family protein [unclassified Roseovarius]|uniref:mandelate racemase/muconate lactonizing enzyme family protein n=1 Tax=unclassified Roseovarius TaxID=2614913 RepID=UPI00273DAE77|nr:MULTISPECIES: mandelate racemase/muconate lactonizing enzyme family protein [unclassified Roseovarius]
MRIAAVDLFQVDLPVKGGVYRLSGGREYTSYDATIVRITTDCGMQGWGESTPFGATYVAAHAGGTRAALDLLAPALIGMDPRHHDRIWDAMRATLRGHRDARTALDVACWDIAAQAAGLPLCDMLGGRIPGPLPVISSIGGDTPEAMRAKVAAHRSEGFKGHSIKIGAQEVEGGPALDAERIRACLADRQPGEWYLADANNGLSPEHALRMQALLPDGPDFVLEAPCATWRETQSLRARCSVPLLLDELIQTEADLIQAIVNDSCDGVGLKVSKQGGITPMIRQRTIAASAGMVMSIQDTVGSEISCATILHIAQSTPRHLLRCALDTRAMIDITVAHLDAPVVNGGVEAPTLPGLGITPDLSVLGSPIESYGARP